LAKSENNEPQNTTTNDQLKVITLVEAPSDHPTETPNDRAELGPSNATDAGLTEGFEQTHITQSDTSAEEETVISKNGYERAGGTQQISERANQRNEEPTYRVHLERESPVPTRSRAELLADRRLVEHKIEECSSQLITRETQLGNVISDLSLRVDLQESLRSWISQRSGSYMYRTVMRGETEVARARASFSNAQNLFEGLELPEIKPLIAARKRFSRRLLISTLVILGLFSLLLILKSKTAALASLPIVGFLASISVVTIVAYAFGVWVAAFFAGMSSYHREWSQHEIAIRRTLSDLQWARSTMYEMRRETARLESLHLQLRDWLELLAQGLLNPWSIDPRLSDQGALQIDEDKFPVAIGLAQATDGDMTSLARLQREAITRILRPGWRDRAFQDHVKEIGSRLGFEENQFSVVRLEEDLPEASNNTRTILRDRLLDSEVLRALGKEKLREISVHVQIRALAEARPPIAVAYEDPLAGIDPLSGLISAEQSEVTWDEFLLEIAGSPGQPNPPMTLKSFTTLGRGESWHMRAKTYLLMPGRLTTHDRVKSLIDAKINTYADDDSRPLDLLVRVDITGPVPGEFIALWNDAEDDRPPTFDPQPEFKVCRLCGDPGCPASDDTGAPCQESL
jgi:hypothetical protein